MRNINSPELGRLFGVPQGTLRYWKREGLIKPVVSAHPKPDEFSPETALYIGLMLAMRRRGLPKSTCISAQHVLAGFSLRELQDAIAHGERWLVCMGPAVTPNLVRAEAVADRKIESACDDAGLAFAVIDVGAAIKHLEAFLDADSTGLESSCLQPTEAVPA